LETVVSFAKIAFLLLLALPARLFAETPVDAKIAAALAAGEKPVVFVDLDATFYSEKARIRNLLERFDRLHGTQLFRDADWSKFTSLPGLESALHTHLDQRVSDPAERRRLWGLLSAHEEKYRFHPDSIEADEVDKPLAAALDAWSRAGAQIVFLSGRDDRVRQQTLDKLLADGFGNFPLFTKTPGEDTALFKASEIRRYIAEHKGTRAVALLDDDFVNLQAVSESSPDVLVLRNTQEDPRELKLDAPLEGGLVDTAQRYGRFRSHWTFEPSWHIDFLPSRKRVHAEIEHKFLPTAPSEKAPIILFTAGFYGSGKTYVVNKLIEGGILPASRFDNIDPDKIRNEVPEYPALLKSHPEQASTLIQLETGHLQEHVLQTALQLKSNIILQGTLRSEQFNQKLFEDIRRNHPEYRIGILWVHADPDVAKQRAASGPYRDGRVVPDEQQRKAVDSVPRVVQRLASASDFVIEVDNTDKPKLTRLIGGKVATDLDVPFQQADSGGLNPELARLLGPVLSPTPDCAFNARRLKEIPGLPFRY